MSVSFLAEISRASTFGRKPACSQKLTLRPAFLHEARPSCERLVRWARRSGDLS